jgi:hypothetical protein
VPHHFCKTPLLQFTICSAIAGKLVAQKSFKKITPERFRESMVSVSAHGRSQLCAQPVAIVGFYNPTSIATMMNATTVYNTHSVGVNVIFFLNFILSLSKFLRESAVYPRAPTDGLRLAYWHVLWRLPRRGVCFRRYVQGRTLDRTFGTISFFGHGPQVCTTAMRGRFLAPCCG